LKRFEPAPQLMLEMSRVDHLDSAGVGALTTLFISRQRKGKQLLLANLTDQATAALELTRLTEVLSVYSSSGFSVRQFGCQPRATSCFTTAA
jgi:anti-anti-sigma factor